MKLFLSRRGSPGLIRAQNHLKDKEELQKELKARKEFYAGNDMLPAEAHVHSALMAMETRVPSSLVPLLSAKLIGMEGDQLHIDHDVAALIDRFLVQLSGEDRNPVEPERFATDEITTKL